MESGKLLPTVKSFVVAAFEETILSPDLQALGGRDVALDAVRVVEERDVRRAVRIVFDRLDHRRDVQDVALEVDDAVKLLVAAADAAGGHAAVHVAAAGPELRLGQGAHGALL